MNRQISRTFRSSCWSASSEVRMNSLRRSAREGVIQRARESRPKKVLLECPLGLLPPLVQDVAVWWWQRGSWKVGLERGWGGIWEGLGERLGKGWGGVGDPQVHRRLTPLDSLPSTRPMASCSSLTLLAPYCHCALQQDYLSKTPIA